jgi:hypothetical protein
MSVFLTGDTHGNAHSDFCKLSSRHFVEGSSLTSDDVVIVCGDFGLTFPYYKDTIAEQRWWLKWLLERPWTTFFVDGNHEDHDYLTTLETVKLFGGTVGKINEKVFHLRRGQVYVIGGKKFFCMGGARTVDMIGRIEGIDWWRGEIASYSEMSNAFDQLVLHDNEVDYIVAHTLPQGMIKRYFAYQSLDIDNIDDLEFAKTLDEVAKQVYFRYNDPMAKFLQEVCDRVKFKHYYCGHFHDDFTMGNFTILYDKIVKV